VDDGSGALFEHGCNGNSTVDRLLPMLMWWVPSRAVLRLLPRARPSCTLQTRCKFHSER
jgi:hypothetical protein